MRSPAPILVCAAGFHLLTTTPVHADSRGAYEVGATSFVITPTVSVEAPPVWLAGYGLRRHETIPRKAIRRLGCV